MMFLLFKGTVYHSTVVGEAHGLVVFGWYSNLLIMVHSQQLGEIMSGGSSCFGPFA